MIQRYKGIGGSDIAALCGLSTYKTPYQLWMEKRRIAPPSLTQEESDYLLFGRLLEAPIAKVFAKRTGRTIERVRKTFKHPVHPFLLANIDRRQLDPLRTRAASGVLECKNINAFKRREWAQGGVPVPYYMQLQHYLAITESEYGSFAVLFGGNEHYYFDVERDDLVINRIVALCCDFWEHVQAGTPPDMTYNKAGQELIKKLCAKASPGGREMILETPEAMAKARRLIRLDLQLDVKGAEAKELEAWFKWEMQDAVQCLIPGVAKFTWPGGEQKRIDPDALRKAYPLIAAEVEKKIPTRRFSYKTLEQIAQEPEQEDSQPLIITSGVRQISL